MSYEPTSEWVSYPDVTTVCVKDIGNYVVNQHNKDTGDNLKLDEVKSGAYKETDDDTLKHKVIIEATDGNGVKHTYEAEVLVEEKDGKKVKTPIYFEPGYIDPNGQFWKKISNTEEVCVQEVSKFAVEKNNENTGDNLIYESTIEGGYREVNPNAIDYDLRIKAKDCFGRVRIYKANVLEEKPLTEKIRTLEYFKVTPKKC